jgi:predicted Fe-Mo cluster-binding NifX family protein
MDRIALKEVGDLTKASFAELKKVLQLDRDLSRDQRKALIETYAASQATKLASSAVAEFAKHAQIDLLAAPKYGCDTTQTQQQAEFKIKSDLAAVIQDATQSAFDKMISDQENFKNQIDAHMKTVGLQLCGDVKTRIEAGDCKELKKIVGFSRNIGAEQRRQNISRFIETETTTQVPIALAAINSKLDITAGSLAVGLDVHTFTNEVEKKLREHFAGAMNKGGALKKTFDSAYASVRREGESKEEAREGVWAKVKWGAMLTGSLATTALVGFFGAYSAPFWIPVGGVVTLGAAAVARWRQNAAAARKDSWPV